MGRRLFAQAERDLLTARRLVASADTAYAAANYANQAGEKAVKAAHFHLRAEEAGWSHDIGAAAEQVADVAGALPDAVERAIEVLEPLWNATRYPSSRESEPIPAELITIADAERAILSADEVLTWVRELLQRPPGRPRSITTS